MLSSLQSAFDRTDRLLIGASAVFAVAAGLTHGGNVDAVEAKINPEAFEPDSLKIVRQLYPHGKNWLICPFVQKPYTWSKGGLTVEVCSTEQFVPCATSPSRTHLP